MKDANFDEIMGRMLLATGAKNEASISAMLGITHQSIYNAKNKGKLPTSWVYELAKNNNISANWLFFGVGSMHLNEASSGTDGFVKAHECGNDADLIMIPRVSARLCAGTGSLETDDNIVGMYAFRAEWILKKGNTKRMVLMDVTGDSMAPDIKHGDIVLVDQSKTDIYGHGYYAVGVEDSIFIKELDMQPGSMILRSLNPRYEDIKVSIGDEHAASVRIIGRVLWVGRELD